MKTLGQLYSDYEKVMNSQTFVEADLDYSVLDRHIPYLKKIDEISGSGSTIYDLFTRKHVFVSLNVGRITGIETGSSEIKSDFGNFRIHPEDEATLFEAGTYFLRFGILTPPEKRKNAKLVNEYRILQGKGHFIRVIEQQLCLENDPHGNIWLALGILDISPDQDPGTPFRSRLIDMESGNIYRFPPPGKEAMLTAREQEILKLISKGLISKEIADQLYISVNTVNTHRQRILEKLGAGNAIEAIKYASRLGLI